MLQTIACLSILLLNVKESCCSLIGLNSTFFLVVPQSEFTSREPQWVYSRFQRCPRKGQNFKISKMGAGRCVSCAFRTRSIRTLLRYK